VRPPEKTGSRITAVLPEQGRTHTPPVRFYEDCINRISEKLGKKSIKTGKVTYTSADKTSNLVLLNSKVHPYAQGEEYFWYGLRTNQIDVLNQRQDSFVAFGCGSAEVVFVIPFERLQQLLVGAPETRDERGELIHKHVYIGRAGSEYTIKSGAGWVDAGQYKI
jgi:hypothetical protein